MKEVLDPAISDLMVKYWVWVVHKARLQQMVATTLYLQGLRK